MEYLNHDPNRLKRIYIEIDKFLINRECIDLFMQIYMQWRKYYGSTSSFQKFIITRLPCFEKLALSQFKVYIKTETMTRFLVCYNYQKTVLIRSTEGKERVFYFKNVKDPYWFTKVE